MSRLSARTLYWAPRILSIALVIFLSLFSLDVFEEHRGFWPTLAALVLHLVPSLVLAAALAFAWRWEWVGAAVYGLAGGLYTAWVVSLSRLDSAGVRWQWVLIVAGPAFLIAGLFLANWLKRADLRAGQR